MDAGQIERFEMDVGDVRERLARIETSNDDRLARVVRIESSVGVINGKLDATILEIRDFQVRVRTSAQIARWVWGIGASVAAGASWLASHVTMK